MAIIKAVFIGLVAVWVCIGQDITISGIVTDTEDSPIDGAVVQLEKRGINTTSEADGKFEIKGTFSINDRINTSIPHKLSVKVNNGLLYLTVAEKSPVEIITYTMQGEIISAIQKTMGVGAHSIAPSHRGAGVYLYKIKTGNNELMIKSTWLGCLSGGTALSTDGLTTTASSSVSKRYAPIDDVIAVTKDGYLNYRVIVTNSDTSNIEIKMIVCAGTMTDIDGNVYQTVKIGNQVWTAKDLRVTRYNDGSAITHAVDKSRWQSCGSGTGAYCYYDNDSAAYAEKYGALYNWFAVGTKKLAPKGWHVPTDKEWTTLQDYLIANGYNWDGTTDGNKIAKSLAAKADWDLYYDTGTPGDEIQSNNSSGFSALPAGFRDHSCSFVNQGTQVFWCSSTDNSSFQYHSGLCYNFVDLCRYTMGLKAKGISVRLLKD